MSKFAAQVADLLQGGDRPVTQYMHDWDGVMTEEAIRRVAELEIYDNSAEGIMGRESGKARIRPSNLGHTCPRLHTLSYIGAPNDVGDTSLMDDGTQRHYYWQKVGLSAGFLEDIEVKVEVPALDIKGAMDGLLVDGTVFEFKVTGPKVYDNIMVNRIPAFSHLLQVHAYMAARGVRQASIVYERRSYGIEWHEFRVDWDQGIYNTLVDRITPVLEAIDDSVLPPMLEECLGLSGPTYRNCDYRAVCPSAVYRRQDR